MRETSSSSARPVRTSTSKCSARRSTPSPAMASQTRTRGRLCWGSVIAIRSYVGSVRRPVDGGHVLLWHPPRTSLEVGEGLGHVERGDRRAIPAHLLVPTRPNPPHLADPGLDRQDVVQAGGGVEPSGQFHHDDLPALLFHHVEPVPELVKVLDPGGFEVGEVVGVVDVVVGVQFVEADLHLGGVHPRIFAHPSRTGFPSHGPGMAHANGMVTLAACVHGSGPTPPEATPSVSTTSTHPNRV